MHACIYNADNWASPSQSPEARASRDMILMSMGKLVCVCLCIHQQTPVNRGINVIRRYVHVYICICIYMYTYTLIHTHTYVRACINAMHGPFVSGYIIGC